MHNIDINLDENPVLFNRIFQGAKNYPGEDEVAESFIKKGDLVAIVQLANPNGGGDYLIPLKEFEKHKLDVMSICQAYQVAPFYDKSVNEDIATYKPVAGIYLANEDIKVATGITLANPQYGPGGAKQLVMPHGKIKIQKAYKDKEMKNEHPLIPIDLNNYEREKHISDEDKRKISEIKESYKDSINHAEGCLNLKNTDIDIEVHNVMKLKNDSHENLYKQIGAIEEYSKELNKTVRNLDYIKELKKEINTLEKRFGRVESKLQDQIDIVDSKPELLRTMGYLNKEHLLNHENYCPQEIKDILNYSKEKMADLESKLTNEEKAQLNVSEKELSSGKFTIDGDKETRLREIYEDTTREGAIEDLGYRARVYIPQAERKPEVLLCNLKAKDELNKVAHMTHNDKIKEFCSKEIEKLDNEIEKLDKEIKSTDKPYKTNIDDKIEYLKEKVNNPNRYTETGQANNDITKESSINKINGGALWLKDNPYCDHEYLNGLSGKIKGEIREDLKKELLCKMELKDELTDINTHSNDNKVKDTCKEALKGLDFNIKNLQEQVDLESNKDKDDIYKKLDYMKEKLSDNERYMVKNHPKNNVRKENEIKDISKNARKELSPEFSERLKEVRGLHNNSTNTLKDEAKRDQYEAKDVSKFGTSKGSTNIYQIKDEPKKFFLGQKTGEKVERLGEVKSLKEVKEDFKALGRDNSIGLEKSNSIRV